MHVATERIIPPGMLWYGEQRPAVPLSSSSRGQALLWLRPECNASSEVTVSLRWA
jgi:hypothetical protein